MNQMRTNRNAIFRYDQKISYYIKDNVNNGNYLVKKSWFLRDVKLQDDVVKLIDNGYGGRIDPYYHEFRQHIYELLSEMKSAQSEEKDHGYNVYYNNIKTKIPNGKYLIEREAYPTINNKAIMCKLNKIFEFNLGVKVNVKAENIMLHLDNILKKHYQDIVDEEYRRKKDEEERFYKQIETEIEHGSYLLGRSWFLNNKGLQDLVKEALMRGLGYKIMSTHGDFYEHMYNIINNIEE